MKTILTFPPVWETSTPYASLAVLSAFLKENNINVDILDLNIETQYFMLTNDEYINNIVNKLYEQEATINDLKRLDSIKLALKLYNKLKPMIDGNLIDKIKASNNEQDEMKYKNISNYLRFIISTCYYPTIFSDLSYTTKLELNTIDNVFKEVKSVEGNIFYDVFKGQFIENFLAYDVVGISLASINQLVPGLTLASMIKKLDPNIKIIIGGAILPYLEKNIQSDCSFFEYADFYIVGEGETALLSCLKYFEGKLDINEIPNTIYKNKNNIVSNRMGYIEDVDNLPMIDYSKYPIEKYFTRKINIPYLASRGCHWNKCSFCSLTCNFANKYRERSINNIEKDLIDLVEKHKFSKLIFNDEALTPKRIGDISDIILNNDLNVTWHSLARLSGNYTDEILYKARKSGLLVISLGLESGCQRTLDNMCKGIKIDKVPSILKQLKKHKIWSNIYYIIGFPTETKEDFMESLKFIEENSKYIGSLSYTLFRLESNSKAFFEPEDYGMSIIDKKDSTDYFGPDYSYKSKYYEEYELNERYSLLYNLINDKACNPYNIHYHFDGVFSFLEEGKEKELYKRISDNVSYKKEIIKESQSSFNNISLSTNEDNFIIQGIDTYMILNLKTFEMYSFNESSIFILKLIERCTNTINGIIENMKNEYNVDEEILKRDIMAVICKMLYLDIIKYKKEVL